LGPGYRFVVTLPSGVDGALGGEEGIEELFLLGEPLAHLLPRCQGPLVSGCCHAPKVRPLWHEPSRLTRCACCPYVPSVPRDSSRLNVLSLAESLAARCALGPAVAFGGSASRVVSLTL